MDQKAALPRTSSLAALFATLLLACEQWATPRYQSSAAHISPATLPCLPIYYVRLHDLESLGTPQTTNWNLGYGVQNSSTSYRVQSVRYPAFRRTKPPAAPAAAYDVNLTVSSACGKPPCIGPAHMARRGEAVFQVGCLDASSAIGLAIARRLFQVAAIGFLQCVIIVT